jgi:hypothetical protein
LFHVFVFFGLGIAASQEQTKYGDGYEFFHVFLSVRRGDVRHDVPLRNFSMHTRKCYQLHSGNG